MGKLTEKEIKIVERAVFHEIQNMLDERYKGRYFVKLVKIGENL